MIEIVVFGKPSTFESYKFDFGVHKVQTPENSHREPNIKPVDFNEPVIHYYKKDGIAGWEVYRRCKSFDSERPGIIFGVGIESDRDFGLMESLRNLLIPLWEDFAQAFIDESNKFKTGSITDALRTTKWSQEEERKIRGFFKEADLTAPNELVAPLLLVISDFEDINRIEDSLKSYSDVYIASDANLFQNLVNRDILTKQANNEIHIVKDGEIVVYKPSGNDDPQRGSKSSDGNSKRGRIWVWGKSKGGNDAPNSGSSGEPKPPTKFPTKLIAAIIVLLLIIGAYFVLFSPKPADRIDFAKPPTGTEYITDGFNLQPTLYHGESKKTSTKLEDIGWAIEGDGAKFISIGDDQKIAFTQVYFSEKPRHESSITVVASIDGKTIGSVDYKLAAYAKPKANMLKMTEYKTAIVNDLKLSPQLSYNGDPDVSTKLEDIRFEVSPNGLATIDGDHKLIVNPNNRPENDTEVTVTAYLDDTSIGSQVYIISKQRSTPSPIPSPISGKIKCKSKTSSGDYLSKTLFTTRDITNHRFIATDDKDNKYTAGGWKCSPQMSLTGDNQNPMSFIKAPSPGDYTLEYWVDNTKKASIKIIITEE